MDWDSIINLRHELHKIPEKSFCEKLLQTLSKIISEKIHPGK